MGASASITSCIPNATGFDKQVFLGGSCNPTTWRQDIAIPRLTRAGITFYNPQVDDWHEGLVKLENDAKANAEILLFVIDNVTRAIASIAEAAFCIGKGRKVVLVVQMFSNDEFANNETGNGIHIAEMKDLNRGRTYIMDIAKQNDIPVFETVVGAVEYIATLSSGIA
jgi:raw